MNGVVIIDKPSGMTSHDVVKRVKWVLRVKKAGHTGTLDPTATGVLPVCTNEATKIVQFLINHDKEYSAVMKLGVETDTQDHTGKVTRSSASIMEDHDTIIDTLNSFAGRIKQKPPLFSAIKYKGVPLYNLARRGIYIDRSEREITISKIKATGIELPYVSFEVSCSKGTYIRTLCADIGDRLGCGAHLTQLRRTRCGHFHMKDAVSISNLEHDLKNGGIQERIIPISEALTDFHCLKVHENLERKIRHGKQILVRDLQGISMAHFDKGENLKITSLKNDLIAVAESLITYPSSHNRDSREKACRLIRVFNT